MRESLAFDNETEAGLELVIRHRYDQTPMPLYEYRCRTCDARFELRRPMSDAALPAACPDGHSGAVRLLSTFAAVGGGRPDPQPASGAGGCCGGGCGCRH